MSGEDREGGGRADAAASLGEHGPGSPHLFAYGTLELEVIVERVLSRSFAVRPAELAGYARYLLRGCPYPAIVPAPGRAVSGTLLLDLDAEHFTLLDTYEGELYERRELVVAVGSAPVRAQSYVLRPEFHDQLTSEAWDRREFERRHLAGYLARLAPGVCAPADTSPLT